METLFQDIRYAVRILLKNRSFTAVAVVALALGIGANSAIFSVVNSVVLRPLPYRDSDGLVAIWSSLPQPGLEKILVSAPELADFREHELHSRSAHTRNRDTHGSWREGFQCVPVDSGPSVGACG